MRQAELKKLIKKGIEKSEREIKVLEGSQNPQAREVKRVYETQRDTLDAVLRAVNNDTVFMRILIGD